MTTRRELKSALRMPYAGEKLLVQRGPEAEHVSSEYLPLFSIVGFWIRKRGLGGGWPVARKSQLTTPSYLPSKPAREEWDQFLVAVTKTMDYREPAMEDDVLFFRRLRLESMRRF